MDEEYLARGVLAYAFGDVTFTPEEVKEINSPDFSIYSASSFGRCMLNQMGLGQIKNFAKSIFSPTTRRLLKSHQYRKAAKIIVRNVRKVAVRRLGKKAGSWLAKKATKALARLGLPGVGWGTVAWYAAKCGWKEFR